MLALLLLLPVADPPPVRAVPPDPPAVRGRVYDPYGYDKYESFRRFVERHEWAAGVLVVGIKDRYVGTYQIHCWVPSGFLGLADGEYDCFHQGGEAKLRRRGEVAAKAPKPSKPHSGGTTPPTAAPTVAAQSPQSAGTRAGGVTYTLAPAGPFGNTRYVQQCGSSGCRLVPVP